MNPKEIGAKVRLTYAAKLAYIENDCEEHIREFGNCIGIIVGYPFPNDTSCVDVRWQPSNLRYCYLLDELEVIV